MYIADGECRIIGEKKLKNMEGKLSTQSMVIWKSWKFILPTAVVEFIVMTFAGANCLVVSPAERERGGSSKLVEAM